MKNKLTDLNDHLFAQLERLNDEDLKDEELERELKRSKSMTNVADKIINNAKVCLDASKMFADYGDVAGNKLLPVMLENKKDK